MSRIVHRTTLGLILAAGVGVACSEPGTAPVSTPQADLGTAAANALASPGWHAEARGIVAANSLTPYAAGRLYGLVSMAQYLAVVDADGRSDARNDNADRKFEGDAEALGEARRGAVAGASVEVLSALSPSARTRLEQRVATEGAGTGAEFARGLAIGRTAGLALAARAANDGFTTPWTGTVPVGEGIWFANPGTQPAGAVLVHTRAYVLTAKDREHILAPPPPAWGSEEFIAAVAEVRAISNGRSAADETMSHGWNLAGGTHTPPGRWNIVATNYILGQELDEREATRVFAVMHAAMADSQIACWEAKLHYWVMRPSQVDPMVKLLFGRPNHPSYPSGHSCLSGAAGTVLTHYFPEHTAQIDAWVAEAGMSRIVSGIHYGFDVTAGQDLGYAVGDLMLHADKHGKLLGAVR